MQALKIIKKHTFGYAVQANNVYQLVYQTDWIA